MSSLRSLGYAISRSTALLIAALLVLGVLVAGVYYYTRAPPAPLGVPVQKITIITTTEAEDPARWAAVQAIAAEWRKLGFDVEVVGLEASMVDKKCYYEWDFDVCVFGWGSRVDRLDPNLFLGLITTEEIGAKGEGANNPTGYSNPEYDRLHDLQRKTLDINERRRIVFELQRIFHEEAPRHN
ncbi:MAG: ABC transporter substrate-binding protein, partial [Acidilobaceae archaeon]